MQRTDLGFGNLTEQRGNEIDLGREITIDRTGRDAGALRHRHDLHCRHAAFAGDIASRHDDGVMPRREPALDIFGAAIRHWQLADQNR